MDIVDYTGLWNGGAAAAPAVGGPSRVHRYRINIHHMWVVFINALISV